MEYFTQNYDPAANIALSALVAAAPIFIFLISLVALKLKGYVAAALTVSASAAVAIFFYGMPALATAASFVYGFLYGLWPIAWIILCAIFLYKLSVKSGYFETLKRSVTMISPDHRIQVVLIAFCFGSFLEGAIGFGAPVAISAALLMGLGLRPLNAAGLSMVANTAGAAFGAVGIPITALAATVNVDPMAISAMSARMLPPITFLIPFFLAVLVGGFSRLREVSLHIFVVAAAYTLSQYTTARFVGPELVNIIAATVSMIALSVSMRIWKIKNIFRLDGESANSNGEIAGKNDAATNSRAGGGSADKDNANVNLASSGRQDLAAQSSFEAGNPNANFVTAKGKILDANAKSEEARANDGKNSDTRGEINLNANLTLKANAKDAEILGANQGTISTPSANLNTRDEIAADKPINLNASEMRDMANSASKNQSPGPTNPANEVKSSSEPKLSFIPVFKAWLPFVFVIAAIVVWNTDTFKAWAKFADFTFEVPYLHNVVVQSAPISQGDQAIAAVYSLGTLKATGTAILLAAALTILVLRLKPRVALESATEAVKEMIMPIVTIGLIVAYAYIAKYSGQAATMGLALSSTGNAFGFFSPVIGWLGVFLTGSVTSANLLFGTLQQVTAGQLAVPDIIFLAANTVGGVVGKIISPQSIAVACAAVGMAGRESEVLRFTLKYSLIFIVLASFIMWSAIHLFPQLVPIVVDLAR